MTLYSLAAETVIWSSTGPIPNDMDLGVSASLLRPSVTHFRHTFERRAGELSVCKDIKMFSAFQE